MTTGNANAGHRGALEVRNLLISYSLAVLAALAALADRYPSSRWTFAAVFGTIVWPWVIMFPGRASGVVSEERFRRLALMPALLFPLILFPGALISARDIHNVATSLVFGLATLILLVAHGFLAPVRSVTAALTLRPLRVPALSVCLSVVATVWLHSFTLPWSSLIVAAFAFAAHQVARDWLADSTEVSW